MLNTITKIINDFLPQVPFGVCDISDIEKPNSTRLNKNGLNTAIMFAFPYKVQKNPPKNISRYCAVKDYHDIIIPTLKNLAEKLSESFLNNKFLAFADYSPILEVKAASKAGLGVIGKNGLLITKEYGSFVFLGEILCDLPLKSADLTAFCINCGACLKACPVKLNKENCLSALTQKKGELTDKEAEQIKRATCFGCDICQNVCPYNKDAHPTFIKEFLNSYRNEFTPLEDPDGRAYNWRGKEVILRNYKILDEI